MSGFEEKKKVIVEVVYTVNKGENIGRIGSRKKIFLDYGSKTRGRLEDGREVQEIQNPDSLKHHEDWAERPPEFIWAYRSE